MMLVLCTDPNCKTVTRVLATSVVELTGLVGERSEWWPNNYHCTGCNGQATAVYESEVDPNDFRDFEKKEIEAQDFFRFMMGVGLPEEQDCRIEVLQKLFAENKVKNIAGKVISGTKRFCIEWLEMENGQRLYFGSSTHGATIYRITEKPSYTEKALENGS